MATSWPSSSKDPRLWQRALVQRELSDLRSRWGAMWGEAPAGDETGPDGKEDSIEIGSHHVHLFSGSVVIFWGARYIIQFSKSIYFGQNVGLFLVIFIRLSSYLFGCLNVCPSTTLTATIWLLKPFVNLKCGVGGLHLMAGLSCAMGLRLTRHILSWCWMR